MSGLFLITAVLVLAFPQGLHRYRVPGPVLDSIVERLPAGTSRTEIRDLIDTCGLPRMAILPPRPDDPLQSRLVAHLSRQLAPRGIQVVDGEDHQARQARQADLVYSETGNSEIATRILLAEQGDYGLSWSLEIDIDGPTMLYGIETWEATAAGRFRLQDLRQERELATAEVREQARQQLRERAINDAIQLMASELAMDLVDPILTSWFAATAGEGAVMITVSGRVERLPDVVAELESIPGVHALRRLTPETPPRLLVMTDLSADTLVQRLGRGEATSCRDIRIVIRQGLWWALWIVGGVGVAVAAAVTMLILTGPREIDDDAATPHSRPRDP